MQNRMFGSSAGNVCHIQLLSVWAFQSAHFGLTLPIWQQSGAAEGNSYEEVIEAPVSLQLFSASDFIVITSCSRKSATRWWANMALNGCALRSSTELCSFTGLLDQKHPSLLPSPIFGVGPCEQPHSGCFDSFVCSLFSPSVAAVVLKEQAKEQRKHQSGFPFP